MLGASRSTDIKGYVILPESIIYILRQEGFHWLLLAVELFLQGHISESPQSRRLGQCPCHHLERQLLQAKLLCEVSQLWRRLLQLMWTLINNNVWLIQNLILKKLASSIRWASSALLQRFLICLGYVFLLKFLELLVADPLFLLQGIQRWQVDVIYAQ